MRQAVEPPGPRARSSPPAEKSSGIQRSSKASFGTAKPPPRTVDSRTRGRRPTSYSKMAPEETAPSISSSYVLSRCSKTLGRHSASHCSGIRKTKDGRSQIAAISGRVRDRTAEALQFPRLDCEFAPGAQPCHPSNTGVSCIANPQKGADV